MNWTFRRPASAATTERKAIVLDTDSALTLDATLAVGSASETVSVSDNELHVETIETQLGEVISGRQMTAVPLNGRSYTDLLSLQAGVAPATSISSSTVQDVGATTLSPSGTLNPGTVSVNGQSGVSPITSESTAATSKKTSMPARRSSPISMRLPSSYCYKQF